MEVCGFACEKIVGGGEKCFGNGGGLGNFFYLWGDFARVVWARLTHTSQNIQNLGCAVFFLTRISRTFAEFAGDFVSAHPDGVGADLVSARGDATANRCHSGLFILSDGHAYFMIGT